MAVSTSQLSSGLFKFKTSFPEDNEMLRHIYEYINQPTFIVRLIGCMYLEAKYTSKDNNTVFKEMTKDINEVLTINTVSIFDLAIIASRYELSTTYWLANNVQMKDVQNLSTYISDLEAKVKKELGYQFTVLDTTMMYITNAMYLSLFTKSTNKEKYLQLFEILFNANHFIKALLFASGTSIKKQILPTLTAIVHNTGAELLIASMVLLPSYHAMHNNDIKISDKIAELVFFSYKYNNNEFVISIEKATKERLFIVMSDYVYKLVTTFIQCATIFTLDEVHSVSSIILNNTGNVVYRPNIKVVNEELTNVPF